MKFVKSAFIAAIVAAAGFYGQQVLAAPLGYTGGTISENFDTLPTNVTNPTQAGLSKAAFYLNPAINTLTGLTGWQGNNTGSSATTEFKSQDGSLASSAGRGIISFGTNGSTERALGALPTSNQINRFGLVLVNNSASTYTSFNLAYTGEQWRRGDGGVNNTMTFAYDLAANIDAPLTSVGALSFSNPNTQNVSTNVALDGNLAANQVAVAGSITGLNWAPGQTLVLRWALNDASGQDNGLAIDNLQFTAQVPEPSTLAMGTIALVGIASYGFRRHRRARG
jgi:large repetitive protein